MPPEAIDVGPDVGARGVENLLGGDEVGGAEGLPFRGQTAVDLLLAGHLGQAEVENLDRRLVSLAGEHQVARLDVAVDEPFLMGVLEPERRLMDEIAGVGYRQRPLGLDHLGQVETFDVLHREDDALAQSDGGIGRDDVRVAELGDGPDLAEEAFEHAGAFHDLPAHHLEHLVPAHQLVVGEVDNAHAAPAELSLDLVIGVVGQFRWQRVGRGRCLGVRTLVALCPAGLRPAESRLARGLLSVADPLEEAVGRHPGNTFPAVRALLQVLVDRLGRGVVELAQAVGAQGLVGRMEGCGGVHREVSGDGSSDRL